MSEIGTLTTTMSPNKLGELAAGCEAKILGPNGELLGPNEPGEIMAKTPTIMTGYVNNDEENATFFDDSFGFVHTGDLGYYDDEGVLYYHGRQKELIKYQNCHVFPTEIEEAALQHPDVMEIGVYGKPDPRYQELVSAVVVKKPDSNLDGDELIHFTNNILEGFKRIRGDVTFVDVIPRNPQGKIIRSKLVALATKEL